MFQSVFRTFCLANLPFQLSLTIGFTDINMPTLPGSTRRFKHFCLSQITMGLVDKLSRVKTFGHEGAPRVVCDEDTRKVNSLSNIKWCRRCDESAILPSLHCVAASPS